MLRTVLLTFSLALVACDTHQAPAGCGDARSWSQRSAEWPVDELFVGDRALTSSQALDLLELRPENGFDELAAALVVAELSLAGLDDALALTQLHNAHSWYADHTDATHADAEQEARVLAGALLQAVSCPG